MNNKNLTSNDSQDDLAIVYITNVLADAHIVAGRLQAEGIPAMINHMAGMNAIGIRIGALGEIRVLVHMANYERALDILDPEDPSQLVCDNDEIIIFDETELDNE